MDSELVKPTPERTRLLQLRCSIEDKLKTLKKTDSEILERLDDKNAVTVEIKEADDFTETFMQP